MTTTRRRAQPAAASRENFFTTARGRPRKGTKAEGSSARSLRLPDSAWAELTRQARARELPLHKLLRLIVAQHLSASAKSWIRSERRPSSDKALAKPARRSTRNRKVGVSDGD